MAAFEFPNPVDEVSARLVAGFVVLFSAVVVSMGLAWGSAVIAVGFLLRVMAGPKYSPLGTFVTRGLRPRLSIEPRMTAGPPKRFAQAIGLSVSGVAAIAWIGFSNEFMGIALMLVLIVAASLEAFLGICLGCKMFGVLMRVGLIPEPVCERCATWGSNV
jgi:hypothetical protein